MRESCKPPPTTSAPWGSFDVAQTYQSTYGSQFVSAPTGWAPPQKIVRKSQHDFSGLEPFQGQSTAAAAYMMTGKHVPRAPIRPTPNLSKEAAWMGPLTTTSKSMFVHYPNPVRVTAFRPKPQDRADGKMELTTTQATSYLKFDERFSKDAVRVPFRPKEQERVHENFIHTSTSRAAYVPHMVTPYSPAKKPKNAMGAGDL